MAILARTLSTQRERDRLLGGHRRAFRPFQFKHDISKLTTEACQSILMFFLVNLLRWRSNTDPQGVGRRQELIGGRMPRSSQLTISAEVCDPAAARGTAFSFLGCRDRR